MSDRLTPTNLAKRLSVSTSTVRRLTNEYSDFLSDTASPRPGGTRIYTEQDVEILSVIVAMRQDNAPEDEIIRAIDSGVIPTNLATIEPPQQPPALSVDVASLTAAVERLATAQEEDTKERQRQAAVELAHVEALQIHSAALERFANALSVLAVVLVVIVLIAVAVAAGWIG